ncbi:hypothetical protein ACFWGN_04185 [Oerskovia sp. NPDC060338]
MNPADLPERELRRHGRYVAAYTERFGRSPRRTPEFTPRNPHAPVT